MLSGTQSAKRERAKTDTNFVGPPTLPFSSSAKRVPSWPTTMQRLHGTSTIYLDVGPNNGILISTCSLSFPPASLSLHALFPTLRRHGYRLLRQRLVCSIPSRVVLASGFVVQHWPPRVDTTAPVGVHSVVDHTLLVYVAKLAARECWFLRCLCCDVQANDLLTAFALNMQFMFVSRLKAPSRVVTTVIWP